MSNELLRSTFSVIKRTLINIVMNHNPNTYVHEVENMAALETAAGTISAHDLRLCKRTAFGESLKLQKFLSPQVQGEQSTGCSLISMTWRSAKHGYQVQQACR